MDLQPIINGMVADMFVDPTKKKLEGKVVRNISHKLDAESDAMFDTLTERLNKFQENPVANKHAIEALQRRVDSFYE